MLRKLMVGLVLAWVSTGSFADTVWMKNGDRLTGTIVLLDGEKMLLKTDYAHITLDWNKVATLESDRELLLKDEAEVERYVTRIRSSADGQVRINDSPQAIELTDIHQLMAPKPFLPDWVWTGNVDFSFEFKEAERDIKDYDIDFTTNARHGFWRHTLLGEYNREKKDGLISSDNFEIQYSLDRFINDRWFWQGQMSYKRDKIEDLRRRWVLGSGPGYQFWDNELGAFSVAVLMNSNDYHFSGDIQRNFYSSGLKWNYNRYLLAKQFELYTYGEFSKPLRTGLDYELDSEAGIRYKLTKWMSLTLKAEWDRFSGKDGNLNQRRYTMGLGVGW